VKNFPIKAIVVFKFSPSKSIFLSTIRLIFPSRVVVVVVVVVNVVVLKASKILSIKNRKIKRYEALLNKYEVSKNFRYQ